MKPKKILKVPLKVIDQYVEAQTGVELSKIFSKKKAHGDVSDAELAVLIQDGSLAEILWDQTGSVNTSHVIAVVESILKDRPSVTSIVVHSPQTPSQQLALPFEPVTEITYPGVVSIQYSDIEEEEDAPAELSTPE